MSIFIANNLILLSQQDIKLDYCGKEFILLEGKQVDMHMEDTDENCFIDNLVGGGKIRLNSTGLFTLCKWNCTINTNGIQQKSELTKNEK
jgi:hypothetical protein